MSGVDPRWMRNPSDELALSRGCTFDEAAGDDVVEFLRRFCRHFEGQWAGQPLEVLDWQHDLTKRLYGWVRPDGLRRFRSCYVEVPKKNGKSTLVSGLGLYHLVADAEPGAKVFIAACDRNQAGIIYEYAEKMVKASPALGRILHLVPSRKRIVYPDSAGFLVALSKEIGANDGINPSVVIFDELHRQPDRKLWDVLLYAMRARRQPIRFSITTAGEDETSICGQEHRYTEEVNAGKVADTEHLGVIYAADPQDDINDPETWHKANPSLGTTVPEATFAAELAKAQTDGPTALANFRRLCLDIWTRAAQVYLPAELWDPCDLGSIDEEALRGRPCYSGLDLSNTRDITALVHVFPPREEEDEPLAVLCRFWLPEETARRRSEAQRVPYLDWAERGLIELTDGASIDYDAIVARIVADASIFNIKKLLCDPWNAKQVLTKLQDVHGLSVAEIRQGYASLSAPTKELERLVVSREINHGGNAALAWMARNAVARKDPAGNVKLDKEKSREKIDGMSALVNALAGMLDPCDDAVTLDRTILDQGGLLVIGGPR